MAFKRKRRKLGVVRVEADVVAQTQTAVAVQRQGIEPTVAGKEFPVVVQIRASVASRSWVARELRLLADELDEIGNPTPLTVKAYKLVSRKVIFCGSDPAMTRSQRYLRARSPRHFLRPFAEDRG